MIPLNMDAKPMAVTVGNRFSIRSRMVTTSPVSYFQRALNRARARPDATLSS